MPRLRERAHAASRRATRSASFAAFARAPPPRLLRAALLLALAVSSAVAGDAPGSAAARPRASLPPGDTAARLRPDHTVPAPRRAPTRDRDASPRASFVSSPRPRERPFFRRDAATSFPTNTDSSLPSAARPSPTSRAAVSFDGPLAALRFEDVPSDVIYGRTRRAPNADSNRPIQARIINGEEVFPPGRYPWMVGLVAVVGGSERFRCGGTLVAPDVVLSASHCWFSTGTVPNVGGFDAIRAKIGMHDASEGAAFTLDVVEIVGHPEYDGATFRNDVSVLRLASRVDPDLFPPVRLNWTPEQYAPGTPAFVLGWGTTETGDLANTLQQANVPLVSRAECVAPDAYPGPPESSLTVLDGMLCAGFAAGGTDACQGDSGGPLVTRVGGEEKQVGIVSWGEGCAQPNKYGVYADVRALRGFLIRQVPELQTFSPIDPGDFAGKRRSEARRKAPEREAATRQR